jgi:hypothetical protein
MEDNPLIKREKLDLRAIINYLKENANQYNTREKKEEYLSRYRYMREEYEFIYTIIINNDLNNNMIRDVRILNNILATIDRKMPQRAEEVQIGTILRDEIVIPQVNRAKAANKR